MKISKLDSIIASLKYNCNEELDKLRYYYDDNNQHLITAIQNLIDNGKVRTALTILTHLYRVTPRNMSGSIKGQTPFHKSFHYLHQLVCYTEYQLDLYKYIKHPQ